MAHLGNPLRLVVFGGIGSGKSSFVEVLQELGCLAINADMIGHEVLLSPSPGFDAVGQRWPSVLLDGVIDRAALARIVFDDPAELAALEAISHPLIKAEVERRVAAAGDQPVVLELPTIRDFVQGVWEWVLIDAPASLRIDRAVARGGDRADVAARIDAQPTDEEWHDRADWIVPNTGSIEDLEAAAHELWDKLLNGA